MSLSKKMYIYTFLIPTMLRIAIMLIKPWSAMYKHLEDAEKHNLKG